MGLVESDKATSPRDEGYIVNLKEGEESWEVTYDGDPTSTSGWTFVLAKGRLDGRTPRLGDRVVVYGGVGHRIRGVDLDGEELFYEDEVERELVRMEMMVQHEKERLERFRDRRQAIEKRFSSLPRVFQARIHKFVATKGVEWWWQFGEYELSACTDAVLIARAAGDELGLEPGVGVDSDELREQLKTWFDEEQAEKVKGTFEGHSGNSWGFAKRLAWLWLVSPDWVVLEHGALTPLVGCSDYGCPHDEDEQA